MKANTYRPNRYTIVRVDGVHPLHHGTCVEVTNIASEGVGTVADGKSFGADLGANVSDRRHVGCAVRGVDVLMDGKDKVVDSVAELWWEAEEVCCGHLALRVRVCASRKARSA